MSAGCSVLGSANLCFSQPLGVLLSFPGLALKETMNLKVWPPWIPSTTYTNSPKQVATACGSLYAKELWLCCRFRCW